MRLYVFVVMISFPFLELRELVKMHGDKEHGNEDPLSYDEVLIVKVSISLCAFPYVALMALFHMEAKMYNDCIGTKQLLITKTLQ